MLKTDASQHVLVKEKQTEYLFNPKKSFRQKMFSNWIELKVLHVNIVALHCEKKKKNLFSNCQMTSKLNESSVEQSLFHK